MGQVKRPWRTEKSSRPRGVQQLATAKEARVGSPTVVEGKHRQLEGVR